MRKKKKERRLFLFFKHFLSKLLILQTLYTHTYIYIYSIHFETTNTEYPSIERPSSIVSPDIASGTREVNGRSGESWGLA